MRVIFTMWYLAYKMTCVDMTYFTGAGIVNRRVSRDGVPTKGFC